MLRLFTVKNYNTLNYKQYLFYIHMHTHIHILVISEFIYWRSIRNAKRGKYKNDKSEWNISADAI